MFFKGRIICLFIFLLLFVRVSNCEVVTPRLTIVFVIDQFSKFYIDRLKDKLRAGLGFLIKKGVNYDNAYHFHAEPDTATGHAAINTGVYAKDHGVVGNNWFDDSGKKIYFPDAEDNKDYAVFDNSGKIFDFGRCPDRLMAYGVSDSFVLNPKSGKKNYLYAISLKDRAAIALAGKTLKPSADDSCKAIWFEGKNGRFTSSKAYFDSLPKWVNEFNDNKKIYNLKTVKWEPAYKLDTSFYRFKNAFNYDFAEKEKFIGTDVSVYNPDKPYPYKYFGYTPKANDVLLDLAEKCIDNTICKDKNSNLVLWVSLSPLDKLGHIFGPYSAELIDIIYHIDIKLERFIKNVQKKIDKAEILYVVTADHGITAIPEMMQYEGAKGAVRINAKELLDSLNSSISNKFEVNNLFIAIENKQLFLDKKIFDKFDENKKNKIRRYVKKFIKSKKGIKDVWTYSELENKCCDKFSVESYYKNQLYPGRTGEFMIHVEPYCQISNHPKGTAHSTPYESDTHVPLIFYQKGSFESRVIKDKVSMLQFANSLAEILRIPKAQQSSASVLPGLFLEPVVL
ncbi:MAG: hypothetical protein UR12_C0025G0021 [candidate division TM6 bacterium GW2011_GWF2_30_66]|jgi:hypothetical protein|nr:MAG: hypothetical protein UR12_C0025G0021 [candidate division TM6 bacterium GW2011_GWF2_30_66]